MIRRALVLCVCVAALAGLGAHYAGAAEGKLNAYLQARNNPAAHDGMPVSFVIYEVTAVAEEHYEVSRVARDLVIQGDPAGLEVGDVVSVQGTFRAEDGGVVETRRVPHPHRWAKQALSLIGLLLGLALLPKGFAWRDGALVDRG